VGQAGVPDKPPELLVAGSVALDTRDGPFGKVKETLGGSAVYFALAASLIIPVKVIAPVGEDGAKSLAQAFSGRRIDIDGLAILEAPTYRWRAHQEHGRNVDLGSSDSIYDHWAPAVPEGFDGWVFVGSMRPDRQAELAELLSHVRLLAADAMLSYVQARPPEARMCCAGRVGSSATRKSSRPLGAMIRMSSGGSGGSRALSSKPDRWASPRTRNTA